MLLPNNQGTVPATIPVSRRTQQTAQHTDCGPAPLVLSTNVTSMLPLRHADSGPAPVVLSTNVTPLPLHYTDSGPAPIVLSTNVTSLPLQHTSSIHAAWQVGSFETAQFETAQLTELPCGPAADAPAAPNALGMQQQLLPDAKPREQSSLDRNDADALSKRQGPSLFPTHFSVQQLGQPGCQPGGQPGGQPGQPPPLHAFARRSPSFAGVPAPDGSLSASSHHQVHCRVKSSPFLATNSYDTCPPDASLSASSHGHGQVRRRMQGILFPFQQSTPVTRLLLRLPSTLPTTTVRFFVTCKPCLLVTETPLTRLLPQNFHDHRQVRCRMQSAPFISNQLLRHVCS